MWKIFGKKEVEKLGTVEDTVEEPKKEFVIKQRMDALVEKAKIIDSNNFNPMIRIYTWTEYGGWSSHKYEYVVLSLDTEYGKRQLVIVGNRLYYGENIFHENEYLYTYIPPYSIGNFMFNITVGDEVEIDPNPMVKYTAEEMDLAILEFEQAIEPIYLKAIGNVKKHKKVVEYFSELS